MTHHSLLPAQHLTEADRELLRALVRTFGWDRLHAVLAALFERYHNRRPGEDLQ